jgi:predicted nucleic acid-binding protein
MLAMLVSRGDEASAIGPLVRGEVRTPPRSKWADERDRGTAVAAVDFEIAIKRPDFRIRMPFAHAYEACIRKGHGQIGVADQQTANCGVFLIEIKGSP